MLPPVAANLDDAHAAIDMWQFYSGKTLDSTQVLAVEVMMACREDGKWAAETTGREMPRQNGKGDEIEVVEFWGLVKLDEAILHTIHDAVLLATAAHERMLGLFDHPQMRHLISGGQVWRGTGQQMIKLSTGGQIWYRTRTGGGGRGIDRIDRLVVDEAQHATDEQLRSSTSTLMAAPDPQMNIIGTAGLADRSEWWWRMRRRALAAEPGAFGYVGHTAEQVSLDPKGNVIQVVPDVTDRELWRETNPGVFTGRLSMTFLEEEFWRLGPDGFAQEHLCVWAPPPDATGGTSHLIPSDVWSNCAMPGSTIVSHDQWSVTITPDHKWSSIGIAGRTADGKIHVECVDRRGGDGWVLDRAYEIWTTKRIPPRIHKTGTEGLLIARLRERGVEVVEVSSAEVAQATGQFISDANAGTIVHLNQPVLNKALDGAELKTGSDGAAIWSQRNSIVEITPLMACTVALGGVPQEAPPSWLYV